MRAGSEAQERFPSWEKRKAATHGIIAVAPAVKDLQMTPSLGAGRVQLMSPIPDAGHSYRSSLPDRGDMHQEPAASYSALPLQEGDAVDLLAISGRNRDEAEHPLPSMPPLHLLVVDEDKPVLRAICEIAAEMGFRVHAANSASAAAEVLQRQSLDMVLMDLRSHDGGLSVLEQMRGRFPRVPIVVMTAFATVNSAVEAMRLGATDYLTKPFAMEELTGTLRNAAQHRQVDVESRRLQETLQSEVGAEGIIGTSPAMHKLLRIVSKVAFATHPVLIVGESGTGKETIAKLIHRSSQGELASTNTSEQARSEGHCPFLQVDCEATLPALLETELFGCVHNEGTVERAEKRGLLTLPGGCTLYLDEIGAMPLDLQAKLLRALQEKKMRPVGGAVALPVTVRIIAASSRNLAQLVETGGFRKDLYFRLNVVNLRVPPLRERREDIPLLAMYFLNRQAHEHGTDYRLDGDVLRILDGYEWPGNVRELEVAVERACSMSSGPVIFLIDMPTQVQGYREQLGVDAFRIDEHLAGSAPYADERVRPANFSGNFTDIVSIADLERQAILTTIEKLNGDKMMAAKLLGIGKTTLYRKLKEYGIDED